MIQLTTRERQLAFGLLIVVCLWALYGLFIKPTNQRLKTLRRVVPQKKLALQELSDKSRQLTLLREKTAVLKTTIAAANSGSTLLPHLENSLEKCRLTPKASLDWSSQPLGTDYCERIVALKLNQITLPELTGFISRVQSDPAHINIKSIGIQKAPAASDLLDAEIQFSALEYNNAAAQG